MALPVRRSAGAPLAVEQWDPFRELIQGVFGNSVQNGQTVLLGGLIQQDESTTDSGIPGLNRIPYLGRLFGSTSRSRNRTELIVLITPRVISNSEDAKQITDEYQRKFESLEPLRTSDAAPATSGTPATITPLKH